MTDTFHPQHGTQVKAENSKLWKPTVWADVADREKEQAQFIQAMEAEATRLTLDPNEACRAAIAFIAHTIRNVATKDPLTPDDYDDLVLDSANKLMAYVGLEITAMEGG